MTKYPSTTAAPPPKANRSAPPPTVGKAKLDIPAPKSVRKTTAKGAHDDDRSIAMVRGGKLFNLKKAEEAGAELLVRVLQGMPIDDACEQIGITVLDYHFLLREFPDIRLRLRHALIDNALRLESRAQSLIDAAQHAGYSKGAQIAKTALDMIFKNSDRARKMAEEIEGETGKEAPRIEAKGLTSDKAPVYDKDEDDDYDARRRESGNTGK